MMPFGNLVRGYEKGEKTVLRGRAATSSLHLQIAHERHWVCAKYIGKYVSKI